MLASKNCWALQPAPCLPSESSVPLREQCGKVALFRLNLEPRDVENEGWNSDESSSVAEIDSPAKKNGSVSQVHGVAGVPVDAGRDKPRA